MSRDGWSNSGQFILAPDLLFHFVLRCDVVKAVAVTLANFSQETEAAGKGKLSKPPRRGRENEKCSSRHKIAMAQGI